MPRDSGRSRYHPIEDGLWCDEKFDANNGMPEAPFLTRAFFAFLSSNRLQRPSGIYRVTIRELAASSRLPEKEVGPLLEELERRNLVIRDRSWLFLPGYLKRQAHNPSVLSAVRANLSSCSSFTILDAFKKKYPLFSSMCPTVEQPSTDGGHNVSTPTVPTGPQVPVPVPVPDLNTLTSSSELVGHLKKKQAPDPNVSKLIRLYHDTYLATKEVKPTINGGKCGTIAKNLLRGRSFEEAAWLITEFFHNPPQYYADKNLWGMDHILSASNTLLSRSTKPRFPNECNRIQGPGA